MCKKTHVVFFVFLFRATLYFYPQTFISRLGLTLYFDWCIGSTLHTIEPPGPVTALWSVPGSGNTWVRFLIQQATGYVTGAHKLYHENTWNVPSLPGGRDICEFVGLHILHFL